MLVAPTGPPCVIAATGSNTWTALISEITTTNSSVRRSSGIVMPHSNRDPDAPSIEAASYTEAGICVRPATSSTVK